ncbi:unnamed protein product [Parnassius apollo]|uniref:(apollo) hypothetical protein n=1 Tax=Parnassius apollo TaxID=110799 RepID=A0A8S3XLE4_PARAO|nr:unnamed protein product [Parnassius apollo]
MAEKVFIYFIILLVIAKPAFPTNSCSVTDYVDSCKYAVRCEIYAGSAQVYSCSSEPYVVFIISHSRIDALTPGFFGSTNFDSRVREIRAIENTWNSIESNSFKYYSKSVVVDLSGTFKNVKILKYLNMSSNRLIRLRYGSLKGLHRTEVLDFSRNNFSELDVNVFHECTELIKLIIDYNNIKYVDVENLMHSLSKLRSLSLGGNPLSCKEIVRSIKITTMRLLEVTSIDKVYHEDNVYGISCGDDSVYNKTVNHKIDQNHQDFIAPDSTLPNIVLIWCSVLTVACVVIGVTVCIYKKKRTSNDVSRLHLRHSVELSGSECPTDLLT